MNHTEFFATLKEKKIAPCYLFEGTEEYIKESAEKALRDAVLAGGMGEMNEARMKDQAADMIISYSETLPFMAEKRLVEVIDSGMLTGKADGYDESANAARMIEYLPHIPSTTCLLFYVHGKADGRKKLYAQLKKQAVLVQFDQPSDREIVSWIARQMKRQGKSVQSSVCQQLMFVSGRELLSLDNEINKLCAYAGDRDEVVADDIAKVCVQSAEYRVFDMATALLGGETKRAFTLLTNLLNDGNERIALLALLLRQCRQYLFLRLLQGQGLQPPEISARSGVPAFALQRTMAQMKKYTTEQLQEMCDLCVNTDYLVKSGQLPMEGSLESAMYKIASIGRENENK